MKKSRLCALGAALLVASLALPVLAQQADKDYAYTTTGQVEENDGWLKAQTEAAVSMKLPAEQDVIRIRGKSGLGKKVGVSIGLKTAGGKTEAIGIRADDQRVGWGALSNTPLPDGMLRLTWPGKWPNNTGVFFVRPNMEMYGDARRQAVFKDWNTLPPASEFLWSLELRRVAGVTQCWLNGQFMNELPLEYPISGIDFKLDAGAALREVKASKANADTGVLPLPVAEYARLDTLRDARVKLLPGLALPKGLVLPDDPASSSISVKNLGRIPSRSDDLVSYVWRRGAVDALPETRIFSVPLATYSYVNLLCAAEEDPALSPAFTVRMTRYGTSRGDALADTVVRLPRGGQALAQGVQRAGEVSYLANGLRKTIPLWLVRVPIHNGQIQDLLRDDKSRNPAIATHRYLDFEILDPVENPEEDDLFPPSLEPKKRLYWAGARSSATVFAAALEESPASLDVRGSLPYQIFYASDKPEMRAAVEARVPGNYSVEWTFTDVDGKVVANGKKALNITAAKPREVLPVPVTVGTGWYATRFRLLSEKQEELVDHRSSFVFLPPDTRKAGFESPYGAWWFHWAHGGEPNLELVGPVLQRAGLRHSNLPESLPESVSKKYGVSAWAIPWRVTRKPNMDDMIADHEAMIRKYLALWPSLNKMMVWWESGSVGAPFPSEMWDQTPAPMDEQGQKNWEYRMEYVTKLAKMVREKFPNLKMQYGNDGNSLGTVGGLLRHKFPREYIDTIATEDLGQSIIPERAIPDSLQSVWFLRETARKLGYSDIPQTAAYEWMNRRSYVIGLRSQAEWHVRDALHALAYGFDTIALGSIHDAGTGYFYSLWGGGGLTRRYPTMEPKPVYAALAAHTQIMDGAKFERNIPTGLLTLYCLEFRRGDKWIYTLWTPRGQRDVTLRLNAGGQSALFDMYGREKAVNGTEIALSVNTAPCYLVSSARFAAITPGKPSFPDDAPPKDVFVVDAMNKAANWTVALGEPKRFEQRNTIPHGTPGQFELKEVNDPEMGQCLELVLTPKQLKWAAEHEFVRLTLNAPVTGPGPYKNAGLWIKGNGGWGDVSFLVQAGKNAYVPSSLGEVWSGRQSMNFEGWNFVRYPMSTDTRWTPDGTVTALLITMPQYALHLTEMEKVPELKIRLKNLSLF